MGIINKAALAAALVGVRALFTRGFGASVSHYAQFAIETNSEGKSEDYVFAGGIPQFREWVGKRVVHSLNLHKISLENRDYELTIGIARNDLEDEQLQIYSGQIEMTGRRAATHPDVLWSELLENGFGTTGPGGACYDSKSFFATTHPRTGKRSAQSNKLTAALDVASFEAAITALRKLTDDRGEPLSLLDAGTTLHLIVPAELEATAKQIVEADRLASGAANTNQGRAQILVNDRLTSAVKWYLAVSGLPVRPFIHQWRRRPELVARNMPTDDNVFFDKEFLMGADGRYAQGYGMWQLMVGSDGTT